MPVRSSRQTLDQQNFSRRRSEQRMRIVPVCGGLRDELNRMRGEPDWVHGPGEAFRHAEGPCGRGARPRRRRQTSSPRQLGLDRPGRSGVVPTAAWRVPHSTASADAGTDGRHGTGADSLDTCHPTATTSNVTEGSRLSPAHEGTIAAGVTNTDSQRPAARTTLVCRLRLVPSPG